MDISKSHDLHSGLTMEKIWLKTAGMQSDLSVSIGITEYALHKFPLYSKTDFFSQISVDDPVTGKTRVDLSKLPGGEEAFKLVANFCYGIEFPITASNVAALRCAASYLEMTDDTRSGMSLDGNLVSLAESHLVTFLSRWEDAVTILKSCEHLQPYAEGIGLVKRCVSSTTDFAILRYRESGNADQIYLSDSVLKLQLDLFVVLIESLRSGLLPESEIAKTIEAYGRVWLPTNQDLHSLLDEKSAHDSSKILKWRRILEVLADLLPSERKETSIAHLLRLLRMAIVLKCTIDSRQQLHRRAGELFDQADVKDLLLLDISDVKGLVFKFASQDYLASLPDPSKSAQDAAYLIDTYLREVSKMDKGLNGEDFYELAQALPPEARPNHDALYTALNTFVVCQSDTLTEKELLSLVNIITPSRLSEDCAEHAATHDLWPLPFIADVLIWQKQYYATKASRVVDEKSEIIEANDSEKKVNAKLREEIEALNKRLINSEATVSAIRSTLREETQALTEDLVRAKSRVATLEQELHGVKLDAENALDKRPFGCFGSARRPSLPKSSSHSSFSAVKNPGGKTSVGERVSK